MLSKIHFFAPCHQKDINSDDENAFNLFVDIWAIIFLSRVKEVNGRKKFIFIKI
jgi:hypothetical protein